MSGERELGKSVLAARDDIYIYIYIYIYLCVCVSDKGVKD